MAIPKVAAIHDLSGLGKCSLTAAIPILSVCGVQAVPLATAVLSNQTAFESYTGVDLSEYLPMIAAEWKKRKLSLDGIFTGYLSNEQQVEWVGGFIDSFAKDDTLILVDPVLGDEGVYYRGFGEQMRLAMRRLCGKADVITPNLTEALLLLGEDASRAKQPFGQEEIRQSARRLSALGPRSALPSPWRPSIRSRPATPRRWLWRWASASRTSPRARPSRCRCGRRALAGSAALSTGCFPASWSRCSASWWCWRRAASSR